MRRRSLVPRALLLAALVAACGGSGDEGPQFGGDSRLGGETSPALGATSMGVLAFDYDRDGDRDLLVTAGGMWLVDSPSRVALLENDGTGAFQDVAEAAGLTAVNRFTNATAFDYDNDGDLDLYLTARETYGDGLDESGDGFDRLYRNAGDGTFADVTAAAGIVEGASSHGAAAGDIDGDGFLDLYVAEYMDADSFVPNGVTMSIDAPGHEKDLLFHNNGDGTFTEESVLRGVGAANPADRYGFPALFLDVDADGDVDLMVPQDYGYPLLYQNDGGVFTDVSVASGVHAVGAGFWMACAPLDIDADGDFDVVLANGGTSHMANSVLIDTFPPRDFADAHFYAALFENHGDGTFANIAPSIALTGFRVPPLLGAPAPQPDSLELLPFGWGLSAFDYDHDGHEDLFQTGSVGYATYLGIIGTFESGAYPGLLMRRSPTAGPAAFADVTTSAGAANVDEWGFILPAVGHTTADLDGDGFLEIVVANMQAQDLAGEVRIFANHDNGNHWIAFDLVGTRSNRDGVGAEIRLHVTPDGPPQLRGKFVTSWSYASDALYFGLGPAKRVARVEIRWPSGTTQELVDLAADQILTVTEP